jgi:hypothetical protein
MRNQLYSHNLLVKVLGACLIVSVLGALMATDLLRADTLPPANPF